MQSTTTTEILEDVTPTLALRPQALIRVRNAFMRIGLIFERGHFSIDNVLSSSYQKSIITARQRKILLTIVKSQKVFSRVRDLGTRVGSFTIDPETGKIRKSLMAETARRNLIQAESHWDKVMNDVRSSEYLKDQADMSNREFTYRTTAGARFPRMVSRSDLNITASTDESERASLHTNFSYWVGMSRFSSFGLDDDLEYSTSADASHEVYDKKEILAVFDDVQLKVPFHASERLAHYGIETGLITLLSDTVPALISSGRRVPNLKSESKSKAGGTYKLTIELEDVEALLSSNEVSVCKIILSVYVKPMLNRKPVSLTEFFNAGENKLTVRDPFMVTIIPKILPGAKALFRGTGMPVISRYADVEKKRDAVSIIKAKGLLNVDYEMIVSRMNDALRDTDQWLNIKHDAIRSFCAGIRELKSQYEKKQYSYITKCGVEFADVEFIKREYPDLFDSLFDIGLQMLFELCQRDGEMGEIPKTGVNSLYTELFENLSGPSVVHSEEIRSPNLSGYGVKPVTAPSLLVRMVLSRILIVGIGHPSHNPLNIEHKVTPHHLVNQKRAEAMLIPLSVMKDNLLVYSLSGSVGVYFKDTAFSPDHVPHKSMDKSVLRKLAKSSFVHLDTDDFDKSGINMIDTLTISALFTVRAPILRVTKDSAAMSDLWFVAPSGLEFDVTPIAMEICHKLSKETLLVPKSRSVIAWHPLFTIIVGRTVMGGNKSRYDVLMLPALRKSTIAKSYHNTRDVLRAVDFDAEVRSHYAVMRDNDAGYIAALRSYVPDI